MLWLVAKVMQREGDNLREGKPPMAMIAVVGAAVLLVLAVLVVRA